MMLEHSISWVIICFFFFQAEDGIRDYKVTGVQTCALPICGRKGAGGHEIRRGPVEQEIRGILPRNAEGWSDRKAVKPPATGQGGDRIPAPTGRTRRTILRALPR